MRVLLLSGLLIAGCAPDMAEHPMDSVPLSEQCRREHVNPTKQDDCMRRIYEKRNRDEEWGRANLERERRESKPKTCIVHELAPGFSAAECH